MTRPKRPTAITELDGRTSAARAARDLVAAIESDLGGADQLSAAERQLVQRSAVTGAILQSMEAEWLATGQIDAATYVALGNAQRRYLETVGLKRRPRDVTTLGDILREGNRG